MYRLEISAYTTQTIMLSDLPLGEEIEFIIGADATLNVYMLITQSSTLTVTAFLKESGASINIYGTYLLAGQESLKLITKQWHEAPYTKSNVIIKGLLTDGARAYYHGTIHVEQDAVGTKAAQENKNILLSQEARALSIPSLEVLTDDVQCSHGSAVGKLNGDHIAYLMTRGLSKELASQLLLESFLLQEWAALPLVQQSIKDYLKVLFS